MFFLPKKKNKSFLTPDEVLFEALNKPNLDISKHEGQLEKPLTTKLSFFPLFGLLFLVVFFVGRIGHLQSSSERSLVRQAQINSSNSIVLVADRGVVTDRWGEPLI